MGEHNESVDCNFPNSTTGALDLSDGACAHPFWETLSYKPGRDASGQRGVLVREQCTACGKVIEHVRPEVSL